MSGILQDYSQVYDQPITPNWLYMSGSIHPQKICGSSSRCLVQATSQVPSKTLCNRPRRIDALLKAKGGHTKY